MEKILVVVDMQRDFVDGSLGTKEALGNLLDNAVKYSPESGVVSVSVKAMEMFVRIGVEDEGPGIPEDELAQIRRDLKERKEALLHE